MIIFEKVCSIPESNPLEIGGIIWSNTRGWLKVDYHWFNKEGEIMYECVKPWQLRGVSPLPLYPDTMFVRLSIVLSAGFTPTQDLTGNTMGLLPKFHKVDSDLKSVVFDGTGKFFTIRGRCHSIEIICVKRSLYDES